MASGLKHKLASLRYERLNARWEIGEWEYRAQGWPQARRCLVARRRIEETEPELTLFTLERYAYRAWLTNLSLTPAGVWHHYDGRAGMERRIRELREDFALCKIPTRAFAANALYLEVVRLAYNWVTAFQRTCVPEAWRHLTLSQLRHKLFWLPGELTRPQRRPTWRLAEIPENRTLMEKILSMVHQQKPLTGRGGNVQNSPTAAEDRRSHAGLWAVLTRCPDIHAGFRWDRRSWHTNASKKSPTN
jgi:hypothetical protein